MTDDGASLICIPLSMIKRPVHIINGKLCFKSPFYSAQNVFMKECMKWQSEKIMLIVYYATVPR